MEPITMTLQPILFGWAVVLSDGRELGRFHGPGARERALAFIGVA